MSEKNDKILQDIIKEIDLNGDGQISYEEFKVMMLKNHGMVYDN